MAMVTVVYWRDIPAQVIAGKGRRGAKRALPERFEQAIDRCAMKVGARGDDAYMAGFRKADPFEVAGDDGDAADATLSEIVHEYDNERLRALIENDGWAESRAAS